MPCDVGGRFSKGVAYPSPFSFSNFLVNWKLICTVPKECVSDRFRPSYFHDVPEALVDKGLEFLGVSFRHCPCFRSI